MTEHTDALAALRKAVSEYDADMEQGGGYEDMVRASGPVWGAVRALLATPLDSGFFCIACGASLREERQFCANCEPAWTPLGVHVAPAPDELQNVIAIARGRVDAMLAGRGNPAVWARLAEDLSEAAALATRSPQ